MSEKGDNRPVPTVKAGQTFTETYRSDEDVASELTPYISQEPFLLCEADFLRIKRGGSKTQDWAMVILLTSLGVALVPLAKFIQTRFLGSSVITVTWEWVAPLIGVVGALLLYVIGKLLPDERKQVMTDIETHFSEAPRRRHLGERQK